MTKNADNDKYGYSGLRIGSFSLSGGCSFGKNVIIFVVDNSSLIQVDNKKKLSLQLGKIQQMN